MKKRLIALLLCVLLCVPLFVGCDEEKKAAVWLTAAGESGFVGYIQGMGNVYVVCENYHEKTGTGIDSYAIITYRKSQVQEIEYTVEIGEKSYPVQYIITLSDTDDLSFEELLMAKPVIYLYPEAPCEVEVKLDFEGTFTATIPPYADGWRVWATPDGTLYTEDGTCYPYLFWEGVPDRARTITEGFCIPGKETEAFLSETLAALGLNEREAAEFMAFWVPLMENNAYNRIQFQYESYTETAPLTVNPAPDSMLRVFMVFEASDDYVEMPGQQIRSFDRHGFAVVEWGGAMIE